MRLRALWKVLTSPHAVIMIMNEPPYVGMSRTDLMDVSADVFELIVVGETRDVK